MSSSSKTLVKKVERDRVVGLPLKVKLFAADRDRLGRIGFDALLHALAVLVELVLVDLLLFAVVVEEVPVADLIDRFLVKVKPADDEILSVAML